ncbi:MAG: GNAT family N-acetyltransferase [Clostridia bacterium]|nr:GNAT family N-acetyltransferase [Clostridia bacterium]
MREKIKVEKVYDFLKKVDSNFPVPLSKRQDLKFLSEKLTDKGTLCIATDDGNIVSMVGGYTENIIDNKAYISVVATLKEYSGKGFAKRLVREFIEVCKEKNIDAAHLYTVHNNTVAVNMYKSLGFLEWKIKDETRKEDLHLIYYIGGDK